MTELICWPLDNKQYTSVALGAAYAARSRGVLFFVIYVGKHPGCSPSELTKALYLDWGYSQRSLNKLAADGFLSREKHGRSYTLTLTDRGQQAFVVSHQVFFTWDDTRLANLNDTEKGQLLALLQKAAEGMPEHV